MKSLLLLILKSFIFAQRTRDQALQIASKILSTSTNYYNISSLDGAVARDYKDNYNTPWFESGILWEAVFRYTQTTHDESKIGFAAKAIRNSSFGEEGSFLGPPSLHKISATVVGKWVHHD